ncbi:12722_t:CDS:2 [Funneliformis geosporum]|nr:12722_t:CDS:2 [Funneliformis geosporum]
MINQFEIMFSTAKVTINITFKTKSNNELIKLLKEFIAVKQKYSE